MKVEVGAAEKEGFVSAYLLRVNGQMVLRTNEVVWMPKDQKDEVRNQFKALVDWMQQAGAEIVGEVPE